MTRFISHNILRSIAGLSLCLGAAQFAGAQTAQPVTDWSNYQVILYDAATIARLNAPAATIAQVPPPQTIVPQVTPPSAPIVTVPSVPAAPTQPIVTAPTTEPAAPEPAASIERDLSQFISRRNRKNVPIIDGAPDCAADDLAIRINITRIKRIKGSLVIDLHDNTPEHFLKSSKVLLRIRQPVTAKEMNVCMPVATPGQYAIGIYHDNNDNEKFDKNFLGIPKEHFGASNNPKFGLEKPPIDGSLFEVTETGANISLRMARASDIL